MKSISMEVCIKNILMQKGIGDIIRMEIDKRGMTHSHFAEQMGFKRSNATNLLARKDWPFSKLMRACEVLECNLFMPELWERLKILGIDTMPKHWYIVSKGFRPGEKHIREKNISERFKIIRETLKLPAHCEFYSLKDTAAERMIKAGYDIKFIQQLFRHHDITITDVYMSSFNPIVDAALLAKFPTM